MTTPIILRYFEAQGRAQALRHALSDAGVSFDDVRVSFAEWPSRKEDPLYAGPFGSLPTLTWGDVTIAEALPIATFIARRLGHYDGLDAEGIGRLEAITSCAYVDIVLRYGDVLWAEVLYPGVQFEPACRRSMARVIDKLARISAALPPGSWLGGDRPTVADFFAAEAMEGARYVLGPACEGRLRARMPALFSLAERVRARPGVARAWDRRPPNFTASPAERVALDRIHAMDLGI